MAEITLESFVADLKKAGTIFSLMSNGKIRSLLENRCPLQQWTGHDMTYTSEATRRGVPEAITFLIIAASDITEQEWETSDRTVKTSHGTFVFSVLDHAQARR